MSKLIFDNESMHNSFWAGNATLLCAYVLGIILFVIKRKQYPRLFRLLVPPCILGTFMIYNPLIYGVIVNRIVTSGDVNAVYSRLLGIYLLLIVLGTAITIVIYDLESKKEKIVFITVCAIMFMAAFRYDSGYKPLDTRISHYYKMTENAKYVNDYIFEDPRILIIDNKDMTSYMKEADHDQYYTYYDMLYMSTMYNPNVKISHEEVAASEAIDDEYPYILCYDDGEIRRSIEEAGYISVWNDGKGILYTNKQDSGQARFGQ